MSVFHVVVHLFVVGGEAFRLGAHLGKEGALAVVGWGGFDPIFGADGSQGGGDLFGLEVFVFDEEGLGAVVVLCRN